MDLLTVMNNFNTHISMFIARLSVRRKRVLTQKFQETLVGDGGGDEN